MSIQVVQGFDTLTTRAELGWIGNGTVTAGTGRFGGASLHTDGGNNTGTFTLPVATRSKVGVHIGWRGQTIANMLALLAFRESGTAHVTFNFSATNRLQALRPGATHVGTRVLLPDVWYGFEMYVEVHDTAGVIKAWIDGLLELDVSGVDTRNGGSGFVNELFWSSSFAGQTARYDDLVIYDDQTTATTAPIGDIRVETPLPNANGSSSQLVGSDGNSTDNYLLVDETPPNGDTDYVESSTVGDKDTYNMGALAVTSGTILAVQARLYARKTDAGARQVTPVYRLSGGTEADGTTQNLASSYTSIIDTPQETKPGGGAWSIADVNGMEIGVKVAA